MRIIHTFNSYENNPYFQFIHEQIEQDSALKSLFEEEYYYEVKFILNLKVICEQPKGKTYKKSSSTTVVLQSAMMPLFVGVIKFYTGISMLSMK